MSDELARDVDALMGMGLPCWLAQHVAAQQRQIRTDALVLAARYESLTREVERLQAECAEHRRHVATGMQREAALKQEVERLQAICREALSEMRLGCSYSVEGEHQKADEHFEALEDALRAALGEGEDDG